MNTREEARERVHGLFNITVTPFSPAGELDLDGLVENIERALSHGYDGILVGGTYGEFPAMSLDERAAVFERTVAAVADRAPVLLCSAHSDIRVVHELTKLAGDLGALPMVTPPYVSEVTDEQILTFFKRVASLSKTGIMIYNAPGIGITLAPPLIEQVAELQNVVALKQGDLNPTVVDTLIGRLGGRIRLFAASDLVFLGPIASGFDGLSSTNSNALPEIILKSFRALSRGDANLAGQLHRAWYPLRALARQLGQPQMVKAAMRLRGWRSGGHVRPPLTDLSETDCARVAQALDVIESNLGMPLLDGVRA
jgi:dihydrodipicolinate synthase/N-acetylneuraminate lyase